MTGLMEDLEASKLVAVVAMEDPDAVVPLAEALLEGGVKFIEITFRTGNAAAMLETLRDSGVTIRRGAGTVRTVEQAHAAIEAGAEFLVAPGLNKEVIEVGIDAGVPFFPGVDSTLGIEQGLALGLDVLKFFPASVAGGVSWLKAIRGPYPDVKFIPTGGISLANLGEYVSLPNVAGIGGSFLAPKNLVKERKFDEITRICHDALRVIQGKGS